MIMNNKFLVNILKRGSIEDIWVVAEKDEKVYFFEHRKFDNCNPNEISKEYFIEQSKRKIIKVAESQGLDISKFDNQQCAPKIYNR